MAYYMPADKAFIYSIIFITKKNISVGSSGTLYFDHANLHINETTHPPRMWVHNTVGGFYYMYK